VLRQEFRVWIGRRQSRWPVRRHSHVPSLRVDVQSDPDSGIRINV
jgi:hypothetical protein